MRPASLYRIRVGAAARPFASPAPKFKVVEPFRSPRNISFGKTHLWHPVSVIGPPKTKPSPFLTVCVGMWNLLSAGQNRQIWFNHNHVWLLPVWHHLQNALVQSAECAGSQTHMKVQFPTTVARTRARQSNGLQLHCSLRHGRYRVRAERHFSYRRMCGRGRGAPSS